MYKPLGLLAPPSHSLVKLKVRHFMGSVGKCLAFLSRDLCNLVELVSRALSHQRDNMQPLSPNFPITSFFPSYFFACSFDWAHNFRCVSIFYLGIVFGRTIYDATVWVWIELGILAMLPIHASMIMIYLSYRLMI